MDTSHQNDHLAIDFHTVLASSVHDIKNSLSLLMGALDQLTQSKVFDTSEDKHQLRILQSEARNISSSLIHLLGIYRAQEDKLPLNIEEVFIQDMLEEVIATHENLLQLQGIDIEIVCPDDLSWYFDAHLISSVINNIIVNCLKVAQQRITIYAHINNNNLNIHIRDDGPGYPENIISNNVPTKQTINFQTGSTHLGLFFAKHIAHAHERNGIHGAIQLKNHPNQGGEFLLTLP